MNKLAEWLVRRRVIIAVLCLLLVIPSVIGMAATKVKYDLLYYLPGDLDTVAGQNILTSEFGKGAFSLCLTEGMSEADQAKLEDSISKVAHVESVIGYASIIDGQLPAEILPDSYYEAFNNGSARLFAVFFDETSSAEGTMDAIERIRAIAGKQCFVSGMSAIVTDTKELVEQQEAIYVAIAVALCSVVLVFTMDSFLLPIIFLFCIAVAVLWNLGTNYFLGEISYITKAVAAVLQLGVTLDYSIFLWHAYKEQKTLLNDKDAAMAKAITLTFSSILGSSLTTIAGFLALCFMSFTLGKDLGIVMSKGVLLGVLGTVVLLPAIIRIMDGAIEKTSHKPLLPSISGIRRFITKHYKALCCVFVVLLIPSVYGYNKLGVYYDMSEALPGELDSMVAQDKMEESFGVSTSHLVLADAKLSTRETLDMIDEMEKVDGVKGVISLDSILGADLPAEILPDDIRGKLESENHKLMLVSSEYIISTDEMNAQIDSLQAVIKKHDPSAMLIGEAPCTKDLITCTDTDFKVVSALSIAAIFIIIALVLKSISLPILLVIVIEFAISLNLCIPYFTGTKLAFVGPILISTIQLGSTVDYAILLTTRYILNRKSGMDKKEAVGDAVGASAQSILVSGLGFFAATFGVGLYSNIDMISTMCNLLGRGALCSVAAVLFLLPALLLMLDKAIMKTTFGMKKAIERVESK